MVRGPRRGSSRADNRHARKMAKVMANSHSGFAGMSIIEMLENELTECCSAYLVLKQADQDDRQTWSKRVTEARGRIRGVAISIAMMRHPLRRYEEPWWNYVKKLEKRHVAIARERMDS